MLRVVYQHPVEGYAFVDSKRSIQLIAIQSSLYEHFCTIICVVDYKRKTIFNKCDDFKLHREQVDELIFDSRYTSPS
jgi:hypothetical protein